MVDYIAQLVVFVAVFGLAASGLNLVTGYGGMFSIAHGFYFSLGAYGYSLLVIDAHWPIPVALIVSVCSAAVIGGFVALPALRLRGDYLVIASLAIQLVGTGILKNWDSLTHGAQGIFGIPFYDLEGITGLRRNVAFALLAILILCGVLVLIRIQIRSPWGRVLLAIREDELAAAAVGKRVTRTKVESWALSAGITAIGGVLYAAFVGFIDPDSFDLRVSISILTMVLIGDAGTKLGPIVGAIIVTGLPELLRPLELPLNLGAQVSLLLNGLLLVCFMMLRPRGICGRRSLRAEPDAERSTGDSLAPGPDEFEGQQMLGEPVEDGRPLSVEDISFNIGGRAILRDVSFEAQPGRVVALIGPNGAGKSTLLDVVTGFSKQESGHVLLGSKRLARSTPESIARQGVVRVFKNSASFAK